MEEINIGTDSIYKLYIAYGSNLNLNQMKHRCPTAKVIGASELKDYELVFRGSRHNAVATIEPCEGSAVPVVLWSIKPDDEKALDRYEGYPSLYDKAGVNVTIGNHKTSAMVYIMTAGHRLGNPSENYVQSIEEGYIDAGFDTNILHNAIEKNQNKIEELEEIDGHEPEQGDVFGMKWW